MSIRNNSCNSWSMKRFFDIVASAVGLLLMSPVLLLFMLLIWLQDFHSPFYASPRAGRHGKTFTMIKLRSMVAGADRICSDLWNLLFDRQISLQKSIFHQTLELQRNQCEEHKIYFIPPIINSMLLAPCAKCKRSGIS